MLNFLRLAVVAVLIFAPSYSGVAASSVDPKAAAVLKASKAATGGAAWDALDGAYEEGEHGGLPYRTWLDFRGWGMRNEGQRGPVKVTMGYDGITAWRMVGSDVTRMSDPAALAEARTTAFVSNNGFLFPARFPASLKYLRKAKDKAGTFDVVEAAPEGGRAVELWFDRKSHMLSRIADPKGTPPTTVTASDYRTVGGTIVPFKFVITDGEGKTLDEGRVLKVDLRPANRALFGPGAAAE